MMIITGVKTMEKAIKYFENMEKGQTEWYMNHDKVSLEMMAEQEAFLDKVRWAIKCLKKAGEEEEKDYVT